MFQHVMLFAADSPSSAMSKMGFGHLLNEMLSDPSAFFVSWLVLIVLVTMSALSWYWTFISFFRAIRLKSFSSHVPSSFWNATSPQDAINSMQNQPSSEPFSKIALDAAQAASHHQRTTQSDKNWSAGLSRSEFVDRALRQAVTRESTRLQSGMILLATVGATAPFVGLLGTVWGIYNALISIGQSGSASIDAVAGPVGEALIMTAIGLFVAIPAVFAFNFFSKINSAVIEKFDAFAHDLHDYFATGSRVQ